MIVIVIRYSKRVILNSLSTFGLVIANFASFIIVECLDFVDE
jgi:hypothetical protein